MPETPPGLFTRLGLALGTFFRLLLDGRYAKRFIEFTEQPVALSAKPPVEPIEVPSTNVRDRDLTPALQLLELLQREGRFIDFIKQDVVSFSDSDVGAAARIVHQGCRRALAEIATIEPIRQEQEGTVITLESSFDAKELRLIGNVQGHPPYRGTLTHRGWRVTSLNVEEPLPGATLDIVAQAEIEL